MTTQDQVGSLTGATAYDRDGDKIGKIGAVYYDDRTNEPTWMTIHTGLFGTNETFVPLQGVNVSGDRVTVAYDKAKVKDAPNIAEDGHLSPQDEEQLYRYYGLSYGGGSDTGYGTDTTAGRTGYAESRTETGTEGFVGGNVETGRHVGGGDYREGDYREGDYREGAVGHDTSGPTTDRAMTRSEEQLRVGTETQEAGRARLRKYVVTEQQNVSVPVSREEVRLEREPITDANRGDAYDGPAISEEEHEVTLHAERPVVDTEAVAVERVRLGKETVTDQETVRGEVRKEEIELEDGGTGVTGGRGVTDRGVAGDRDRDGVPDAVDRHDDRGVGEKVRDAVTPDRDRTDRR
jgi:uncharacterized protein (TIGR02271 family)